MKLWRVFTEALDSVVTVDVYGNLSPESVSPRPVVVQGATVKVVELAVRPHDCAGPYVDESSLLGCV